MEKAEIHYPCDWSYKIIGANRELIAATISMLVASFDYELSQSNQSKNGKFTSFNLSVRVHSDEERMRIFDQLKDIQTVKFVL